MTPAPRQPSAAGFVHLADLLPATVTIAQGGARVVFSAHELEARLGIADFGARIADLLPLRLVHSPDGEEKRGEGGDVEGLGSSTVTQNAFQKLYRKALAFGEVGNGGAGERGEGASQPVDTLSAAEHIERIAGYLATRLRDEKSLAFYRLVARAVPREVVRDALARALDVPQQSIRRSRAALFAHLMRPHMPRRSPTNPQSPC